MAMPVIKNAKAAITNRMFTFTNLIQSNNQASNAVF